MIAWLLIGALVAFCAVLAVEGYLLLGRQRLLLRYAAQLLGTSADLLALVPSKSAPRTDGTDEKPRRWWQRLALSNWTVEVDTDDAPSTDIAPAVDVIGGARLRPSPRPRTDVDLSRFEFAPEGRRARVTAPEKLDAGRVVVGKAAAQPSTKGDAV